MEDITKSQIARLVLGYLKNENCKIAYNYFYKQCPYLDKYRQKSYKICTRHNGLTLEDILLQYSEIFSIVQARLEETEYFSNRSNHFMELPEQIIYLLDENTKNKSRSSTPITTSPFTPNDGYDCNDFEVNTLSSTEKSANLDTNATPLKTLPGNTNENEARPTPTPGRKANTSETTRGQRTSHTSTTNTETEHEQDESSSGEGDKSKCIENAVKVFRESLLADEQLQERIAHTINDIQALNPDGKENSAINVDSDALDSAMKAILFKTQSESVFDSLIDEILGSSFQGPPPKTQSQPLPSTSMACTDFVSNEVPTATNTSSRNPTPGDIIVVDSASFINQQSMCLNGSLNSNLGSNLLMIKQTTPGTSSGNPDPSGKQVYFISTPQALAMNQQGQSQYVVQAGGLTEQDILSMPTVIVCEDQLEEKSMVEQVTHVPEKRLKTLLPVKRPETLTDFITLYKCSDTTEDEEYTNETNAPVTNTEQEQHPQVQSVSIDGNAMDATAQIELNEHIDDTKTPEQSKLVKVPNPPTRSGNRSSHVRALDFKFQTPAKGQPGTSPKSSKGKKTPKTCQKSAKTLFASDNKKVKANEPWDQRFRTFLSSEPVFSTQKLPPKAKIEKEVGSGSTSSPNENFDSNNSTKGKSENGKKKAAAKKKGSKAKASKTPAKISKSVKLNETTPANNTKAKSKILPPEVPPVESVKEEAPRTINLININNKPNYKRKCNMECKKEVMISIPKEPVVIELMSSESDRLVLSPSKLNGNKRSLVEVEVTNSMPPLKPPEPDTITPDCAKMEAIFVPPSIAKRNITPMLETPCKDYPKTPSFFSPANMNDTPLTKVFKEQMDGVDIASIPTPQMLLTPNFAFTPLIEQNSSTSNRPTDYSTSSSYYQPSDTEQNRSLEMLIMEECKTSSAVAKHQQPSPLKSAPVPDDSEKPAVDSATVEKIKKLSTNVIARKNLNLMNKDDSSSSSSSSSSSNGSSSDSTAEEDETSDSEVGSWAGNDTVVQRSRESSLNRYPLRSKQSANTSPVVATSTISSTSTTTTTAVREAVLRTAAVEEPAITKAAVEESAMTTAAVEESAITTATTVALDSVPAVTAEEAKEISSIVSNVDYVPKLKKIAASDLKDPQTLLLTDLDVIRRRTIVELKFDEEEKPKKQPIIKPAATKAPPKKTKGTTSSRTTATTTRTKRTLRSNSIKVKESDVSVHSDEHDEEHGVQPMELVEIELSRSMRNTTIGDSNKLDEPDLDDKKKNENEMKRVFENEDGKGVIEKLQVNHAKNKTDDRSGSERPSESCKAETMVVPIKKRAIVKRPGKKTQGSPKKSSKTVTKTNLLIVTKTKPANTSKSKKVTTARKKSEPPQPKVENKDKEKPPKEAFKEKKRSEPKVDYQSATSVVSSSLGSGKTVYYSCNKPEQEHISEENKILQQSAGQNTETMLDDLKARGIHLIPKTGAPENGLEDGEIVSDQSEDEAPQPASAVCSQAKDKLGRCITTINTPENELVFFDIEDFTEPINVIFIGENDVTKVRDTRDDHHHMTKALSMTVYDDINDAEIEKKMTVSQFDFIFESPSAVVPKRKKIKVLHNVVIKKDTAMEKRGTPLAILSDALGVNARNDERSERNPIVVNDMMQLSNNSPLVDLYKTETNSSKRFKKTSGGGKPVRKSDGKESNPVRKSDGKESNPTRKSDGKESNPVGKGAHRTSESKGSQSSRQENAKQEVGKQDKKRKAEFDDSDGKRVKKMDDCRRLLKNFHVDNVLDKLYE